MARRKDHSRAELKQLALAAAQSIIRERGLEALTARSIAARLGYSPGTLYNIFHNLDDIILQVNGRTLDDLHAAVAAVTLTGEAETDLPALLQAYVDFIKRNDRLWAAVLDYNGPPDTERPAWYALKVKQTMGVLETALAPLVGDDDRGQRRRAAALLWASFHGLFTIENAGNLSALTDESATDLARHLLGYLIAGLRATAGRDETAASTGGDRR